jgi:hypothetical protein
MDSPTASARATRRKVVIGACAVAAAPALFVWHVHHAEGRGQPRPARGERLFSGCAMAPQSDRAHDPFDQIGGSKNVTAMLRSALLALPIALSVVGGPSVATADSQRDTECNRDLSLASTDMSDITGRLKGAAKPTGEEKCAAYRQQFLVLVRARAILVVCPSGPARNANILRLDGTIEDVNGAIAESCAVQ